LTLSGFDDYFHKNEEKSIVLYVFQHIYLFLHHERYKKHYAFSAHLPVPYSPPPYGRGNGGIVNGGNFVKY